MKNIILKTVSVFILTLLAVTTSFAQATASATATVTIVAPIAITKTVDMNFGSVAVKSLGGTVVLATDGGRTATGDVTIASGISGAAASFDVTGEGNYTYAITLPSTDYTITRVSGSETMTVNTFVSNPSGTGALTAGAQTLTVGATLNVAGSQVAGTYTNAIGFDVTVNYN
jgi:hypothetical protein